MRHTMLGACLLVLSGCGGVDPVGGGVVPPALPAPDEARRVSHPAGYSIVFPPGLQSTSDVPAYRLDNRTEDALGVVSPADLGGADKDGGPRLTVRRFSAAAVQAGCVPSFYQPTQFQGQPAFSHFDPGYGPGSPRANQNRTRATAGGYSPVLDQELIFERNGAWFQLSYSQYNLENGDPVHTAPLESVQRYFETFEYKPAANR